MIHIGIMGDHDTISVVETIEQLISNASPNQSDIQIKHIDFIALEEAQEAAQDGQNFEILVVNSSGPLVGLYVPKMRPSDILVINTDNKDLFHYLENCKARLITYGFSSKACITASSVVDEGDKTIQCCIQRNIPTYTGGILEPQEFSVCLKNQGQNIYSILAAVTAVLLSGIEVPSIQSCMF